MKIRVCGSISPYPKGCDSCPSFLIEGDEYNILLDCGAGSLRNIDALKDLRNLIVFISHYHPDHYSDLTSLLYASYTNHNLGFLSDRVKIFLPDEKSLEHDYIISKDRESFAEFYEYNESSKFKFGDVTVTFSKNPHPIDTYSTRIDSKDGSIVYSADTGYKENTITTLAKNADILICEASYLKEFNRKSDTHLFAHEAGMIAKKSDADRLYLFHTYPEIDKKEYLREAKEEFINTDICHDGMTISLRKK